MRPRKIIFLDIDGVLVTARSYQLWRKQSGLNATAMPECVAALNHITDSTGAGIVVSSTWRLEGIMFCKEKLREWGVKAPVVDVTPRLFDDSGPILIQQPRGSEIAAWLKSYPRQVESYVILDDDSDMGHLLPRLVRSGMEYGLTMELAEQAIVMLNTPA